MKHRIDIRGRISPNDDRDVLEFWDIEYTTPSDVHKILDQTADGDDIDVYINSGGGEIFAGSEIYTALREQAQTRNINIYITGVAASAASVIAMAAHSAISPTAQLMVHCVSTIAAGNHNDMERAAEELREADRAMCRAYMDKSGMSEEDALALMEAETWLSASRAVELGLIDEIMFEESTEPMQMVADVKPIDIADLRKRMEEQLSKKERSRQMDLLRLTQR